MGNCDTYDANALRCRPLQAAWVWRRAYFTAMFRYFTLNTWAGAALYQQQAKEKQKSFLEGFRDALIQKRRDKLEREQQALRLQQKQKKKQNNKLRYQQQKRQQAQKWRVKKQRLDGRQQWAPQTPTVPLASLMGRFHQVSEVYLE